MKQQQENKNSNSDITDYTKWKIVTHSIEYESIRQCYRYLFDKILLIVIAVGSELFFFLAHFLLLLLNLVVKRLIREEKKEDRAKRAIISNNKNSNIKITFNILSYPIVHAHQIQFLLFGKNTIKLRIVHRIFSVVVVFFVCLAKRDKRNFVCSLHLISHISLLLLLIVIKFEEVNEELRRERKRSRDKQVKENKQNENVWRCCSTRKIGILRKLFFNQIKTHT